VKLAPPLTCALENELSAGTKSVPATAQEVPGPSVTEVDSVAGGTRLLSAVQFVVKDEITSAWISDANNTTKLANVFMIQVPISPYQAPFNRNLAGIL
jgi:hypothetical protein